MAKHLTPEPDSLQRVVDCLQTGGVVVVPTDTVLGLAAHPGHPTAVARIYALKDRPLAKALPIMAASADQIAACGGVINDTAARLLASPFVPGALTLVVGLRPDPAPWLHGRVEMAFRIPADAFLLDILRATGPLCVTSANRSGLPTPSTAAKAAAHLTGPVDVIVAGGHMAGTPSTLVNCRVDPPVIERLGALSPDDLQPYLVP